ncbi:MAG TPA: HYR domain-containing protein, partial [Bacteroidales bacterium]|nr:HYR domain-containing protein [Bacteroidales bacterium]
MKNLYVSVFLLFIFVTAGSLPVVSQTATATITYSGFQACGGCTVCGADYWCTNTPGSYCGDTPPCITRTFFDPVPAGNTVTNITINYWTASCVGALIYGTLNGFNVPVAYDGATGCLCDDLPCSLTTSVTANYPCGVPGYVYGGNNSFQLCSSTDMCINRAEFIISYYPTEVVIPNITPAGPITICPGTSQILTANSGFSAYHWNTGANTQSITVSTGGTYTVTVTGITGCTSNTASVLVTVADNTNPAITCPGNITVNNTSGLCSAVVNYTPPSGTDNCPAATTVQTAGLGSGATYPVGTTTNSFRVTDVTGKTANCSFTVTVNDNQNPTITCPTNITVNNTAGACGAVVNYTAPAGTDNCSGATTVRTAGLASGATFPVGTTTNTFRVTDAAGRTNNCSFTVTVIDNQAPAITCPSNITVNNTTGVCGAVVSYTAPTGTDNCSGATTTQTAGLASGATFPVGTTTNTFRVTDATGKTSTCSFTVTVNDNQAPAITCPANITVNNTTGLCGAAVTYTAPVGTDNCTGATTTQTAGLASGATFPVGTTTNTFRVTDASGKTSTCSFTVTVNDNQAPSITCPSNITVNNTSGLCGAAVTYTTPVGTDNCTGATTTQTAGLASGATFPVGTTTNTFRVTDASGKTNNCSFTVTVVDNQAPSITCPTNITVNNTTGLCGATVTYTAPTGTDNCTGATTTQTAGSASGATFPVGTTTNTFRVTDATGKTSTCSFTVTVNDNQAPIITCPSNITVSSTPGVCGAVVSFTAPTGTDNCPGATTTQISGLASGATFPLGVTTNTFRVTDATGKTSTCSFTVTVGDNQPPTITCPTNITVNNTSGLCGAIVNYTTPVGTDDCPGAITTQTAGLASGATYPVGVTTNVFRVTDAAGMTSTCSFTVTVNDNQAPAITCPTNITVNNTSGLCGAIVNFTTPAGTDNCPGSTTTQTAGLASGATYPVGVTTNTFRVTDASGKTATCSFTVTVNDNQAPAITCPTNITVNNTSGLCSAVVNFTAPVGTDNCPGATTTQTSGLTSGSAFPVGTTTNSFRVTDAAGNTKTCSFTVTVNDNQAPVITCPTNITVYNTSGLCGAIVNFTTPTGTDNCPGATTTQTAGLASGLTFPVGVTTNSYRVTDAVGNTGICSFTVTVNDNQTPTITCPTNIIVNSTSGLCGAIVNYTAPTGTDNCTGATTTQTAGLASGATFPVGVTTNIFRVTDATGNSSTCSFTVTVNDNQAPAITCPTNITVNNTSGLCSAIVNFTTPVGTDNCPGATTTQISGLNSGSAFPVGTTTNIFRVTDAAGSTKTCSFTVTVNDNQAPVITCPTNITVNNTSGVCGAIVNFTEPTGTDNCPGATTIQTGGLASGSTYPVGITTNSFRVTDAAGNTGICSFTVTVNDNQNPAITCPTNVTVNNTSGLCGAVVNFTDPEGTDNCTGATTAQTGGLASGSHFPVGVTTNIFTVTDAAGNTSTCSFTVTVNDNENPAITCPTNITVNNTSGLCGAMVYYTDPAGTDNCPGATTTQTAGLASGSTYPVGTTTNSFMVTDAAGNTNTCSFTVTVHDNQPPLITCPGNITETNTSGSCDAVINYSSPTATDNCQTITTTQTAGLPSGSAFPVGTTVNTFLVTDAAGNTSACSFTVTIHDNEAPLISCPSDITVNTATGLCGAPVNYTMPAGTDN